jgi:hypothetical protein
LQGCQPNPATRRPWTIQYASARACGSVSCFKASVSSGKSVGLPR